MKQYHVYELFDQEGTIVYVGMSYNPKNRLYSHTKIKPGPGHGTFYGRTDLDFRILSTHPTRKEAMKFEGARKLELGMEWTELLGKLNGKVVSNKINTCQFCNKTMKGIIFFRHHGPNCKLNPSLQAFAV
jgi:predicted GIY-YIG superfamily endonuclease